MHTWFSQSQSKLLINLYLTPIFYFLQSIFYLRLQPFRNHYLRKLSAIGLFANQKRVKTGFSASNLAQTLALLYAGAGLEGASCQSGRRTFLTKLASKGTAIHILKKLAGHRSIRTTAAYLYNSPSQLKAAVELV